MGLEVWPGASERDYFLRAGKKIELNLGEKNLFAVVILVSVVFGLFACMANIREKVIIPNSEAYEYTDLDSNRYFIVLRNGVISDSSFLYNSKDSLLKSEAWGKSRAPMNKNDSLLKVAKILKEMGADTLAQRSTESILKTLRKNTPDLRESFNLYTKKNKFYGKVTFRFNIRPSGKVASIFILGNTTGNHDFAISILKEMNKWTFEKINQKSNDIVTIPFTFSE